MVMVMVVVMISPDEVAKVAAACMSEGPGVRWMDCLPALPGLVLVVGTMFWHSTGSCRSTRQAT